MLSQYDSCPLAFYYTYYLGLKLPTTQVYFKFGDAIHESIAILWTTRDLQKAQALFLEMFLPEHLDDMKVKNKPITEEEKKEKYEEMKADGLEMLAQMLPKLDEFESIYRLKPIKFEIPFKGPLIDLETGLPYEVPLSCRIDMDSENQDIVDFKTSADPYDIFETRASIQFLLYAWLRYQQTKKIPTIHVIVLIKKRKKEKIQHLPLKYTEADLLAFNAKIRSMLGKINNKEFNRPLKDHSYFCDCKKYEELLKN